MIRSQERWKTPLDEHQHHGPLHHRSNARTFSASRYTELATRTPTTVVGIPAMAELEGDSPTGTVSELRTTPVNPTSRSSRPNPIFSPLSPSIYSRNTDGMSILPNDSVMSFDATNDDYQCQGDSGSAVIITSHAIKSYVIGTPSPRHMTDSMRSSKDWKAWLSREVSELGCPLEEDMTINEGYTPTIRTETPIARHHRELTQIDDDIKTPPTIRMTETQVPSPPPPPPAELSTPVTTDAGSQQQHSLQEEEAPLDVEIVHQDQGVTGSNFDFSKRSVSPLIRSPAVRRHRHSSAHSYRSAKSRSSAGTPRSSNMNERFPFIDTGRDTSINSARLSRSSRSATESGSSTRSRGTPVSKVYSDLSAPGTVNWAPQITPQTRLERSEDSGSHRENLKENATPSISQPKTPGSAQPSTACLSPHAIKMNRPKSMLPILSVHKNGNTPQHTQNMTQTATDSGDSPTSPGNKSAQPKSLSNSPQRQRMRINMPPVSPKKLTTRPKSAFELRSKGAQPITPNALNTQLGPVIESPRKKRMDRYATRTPDLSHISISGRSSGIDQDTLRMLLESPWAISGPPPSPRSSIDLADRSRMRPKLHAKHSSSTLALHREPSPGLEEQTIDAVIDERPLSRRSNLSSICGDERGSVTGRITPGQRMAEKFLRERTATRASATATPSSDVGLEGVRTTPMGGRLEREDTPAFL